MVKDQRSEIDKQVLKAEQLFRARQFKKAGKKYYLAGNSFLKLNEFEEAKDCFLNGSESFLEIEKFDTVIELFRKSGEACLYIDKYLDANQIYKEALSYIPKLKNERERSSNLITFSVLSYLCSFLKGDPEGGLDFIKRIQKKIDKEFFKENPLIKLVSEITISLRDNQIKYVEKIIK